MEDVPDAQSASGDRTSKDPTANNIHSATFNLVPEINSIFPNSPDNFHANDNTITTTDWNIQKNVQQPLTTQHPLYKIAHGLIQNQQLSHAAMRANPQVQEALKHTDWDTIPQIINSTRLVNDTTSAQHNDIVQNSEFKLRIHNYNELTRVTTENFDRGIERKTNCDRQ